MFVEEAHMADTPAGHHIVLAALALREQFDPYFRHALERCDPADHGGGPEHPALVHESGAEVGNADGRPVFSLEHGFNDRCIALIRLGAFDVALQADCKLAPPAQQFVEDRLAIKTRQAEPGTDAILVNQAGDCAIANDAKFKIAHPCPCSLSQLVTLWGVSSR